MKINKIYIMKHNGKEVEVEKIQGNNFVTKEGIIGFSEVAFLMMKKLMIRDKFQDFTASFHPSTPKIIYMEKDETKPFKDKQKLFEEIIVMQPSDINTVKKLLGDEFEVFAYSNGNATPLALSPNTNKLLLRREVFEVDKFIEENYEEEDIRNYV